MKHSLLKTLVEVSPDNFITALAEQCLDLAERDNFKQMSPVNAKILINESFKRGYHEEVIRVIKKAKNLENDEEVQTLIKKASRPKIDCASNDREKTPVVNDKRLLILG
jgi:hypothetical protein